MRRMFASLAVGLGTMVLAVPGPAQDKGEVKLDVVKYDGLKEAVLRQRVKVVLVDFWGEF